MIDPQDQQQIRQIARQEAESVYNNFGTRFGLARVPRHIHNGKDSEFIPFESINPFKEVVRYTIAGTAAATAGNYGVFWIAPRDCMVTGFQEVHQTAGTDAGAVTIQLEKLTGTQAPDGGVVLLNAALSLKATINTVQDGVMATTVTSSDKDVALAMGDRLCLKDAGALTAVANVTVVVYISYKKI